MGYTKIVKSGDIIEIYQYERPLTPKKPRVSSIQGLRKTSVFATKKRRSDNLYRLRKGFIRICNANLSRDEAPAFATFTMYQIVPLKRAVVCFSGFAQRLRRKIGRNFRYIAVPEFQERGAVHFHVLFWGLPHGYVDEITSKEAKDITEEDLYEANSRVLQNIWGRGYVDCFRTDGSPKLAAYFAKYMQKHMQDVRLGGEKAYYCSRNIVRPMSVAGNTVASFIDDIVPVDNSLVQSRTYMSEWLGRTHYKKIRVEHVGTDTCNS